MKSMIIRIIGIVFLIGLISLGIVREVSALEMARIKVAELTQIDGEQILLGKIAHIEGNDPRLIQKLNDVVIGRSALPGKRRVFEARVVSRCLKQHRINPDQLTLDIPPRFAVERSAIEISRKKIESLVSDFIRQNIINDLADATIKDIRVAESVKLPAGRITYFVKPPRNSDISGKIPLTVNFEVNGKFYKRIWATATIEVLGNVVVTKKPLGRHKPITEDDIEVQRLDLTNLPSDVITDPEVILGQRTRRSIGTRTVMRSRLVEFPPLLKRGDVVVIIAETGGLKITALGEVKKKGRLGERIPVINFDSKKVLYARVVDANTVKVDIK